MMLFALLLAAADRCAPPAPARQPDPAAAEVYVEVAESERGHETALMAFREALRLDPSNARAQAGLEAECNSEDSRFARARELMEAGDREGAIRLLEEIPSPAAALLEGICLYELGEDEAARPLLLAAQERPSLADSARFFLGLIALRQGDEEQAARHFQEVAQGSSPVSDQAGRLLRVARTTGRLSLSVMVESGYDSNVTLSPAGTPLAGDGLGSAALALAFRPMGDEGLFLRAAGLYRAQVQLHDYDLGAASGAAGWTLGSRAQQLSAEYDYDFLTLGRAPYLSAHRLSLGGRLALGSWTLGGTYAARFESYRTATTSAFSGVLHGAELWGALRLSRSAVVEVAYRGAYDATVQIETSYLEHGPRAGLRIAFDGWRVSLETSAAFRVYQDVDVALGVQRQDALLDAMLTGEVDVGERWTARLVLGGRDAISNVADLAYLRGYAMLGLSYAVGIY
jgi:tetratricopeptide (TPR) repeat protein